MTDQSVEVLTLREWRRRRLQTVRSLADAAGTSPRTVVELEAGRRTPRVGTIRALSAALRVEPEQVAEFRIAMAFRSDAEAGTDEG